MAEESESTKTPDLLTAIQSILDRGSEGALVTLIGGPGRLGTKYLLGNLTIPNNTLGHPFLDQAAGQYARHTFIPSKSAAKTVTVKEITANRSRFDETQLLFERIAPEPRLIICGAGHVGAALARMGPGLGFRTILIDDRPELLKPELFPGLDLQFVRVEHWLSGVRTAVANGLGAYVAIVTRGHAEDQDCLHGVLSCSPDYVGMIGSKRRTNIVLNRLRKAGFHDEDLALVRAPIGLDIGAITPEEVALAILAEIVAERRGGSGQPLSAFRRTVG